MKYKAASALRMGVALCASVSFPSLAWAQSAPPAPVKAVIDGNGVDLFAGQIKVAGPALTLGRDENTLTYRAWNSGSGWSDSGQGFVNTSGSTVTVSIGDKSYDFLFSGGVYTAKDGKGDKLTFIGSVYTFTMSDGTAAHFNTTISNPWISSQALITDITDPNGSITYFNYSYYDYCYGWGSSSCPSPQTVWRLSSITNVYGYTVSYLYSEGAPTGSEDLRQWSRPTGVLGSNAAASTPIALGSQAFSTATDGSRLITDALSRQTKFRMSGNKVAGVTRPGNTTEDVTITYDTGSGRVTGIATPAGGTSYGSSDAAGSRTVTVTDALSHTTTYVFDITSQQLTSRTDALGHSVAFAYDASGRVTQVTLPEGNQTQITYDARGNVTQTTKIPKSGSGLSNISTTAGYDATCTNNVTCNQPNWTRDAKNNQTDYVYDSGHGGLLSVTLPADTSGKRSQTRYSYTALQAYYRNYYGYVVPSGHPVYKLRRHRGRNKDHY